MRSAIPWVALVLAACGAEACRAAAPPAGGPRFRCLSLAEAVNLAAAREGHRVEANSGGPLLLRLRHAGAPLKAEQAVSQTLLDVEVAYWNLYGACWALHSREQGLRLAHKSLRAAKARHEAGQCTAADVYQAQGQCELFRSQRAQAVVEVLESERQLRSLTGLAAEGRPRLVPSDPPALSPRSRDWEASLEEALAGRPELRQARLEGAGDVADPEIKAQSFLGLCYRRLHSAYEQIRANRAQREALAELLRGRQKEYQAGRLSLNVLLEAQRFWAEALTNEYRAVAHYNNALAGFEFAKGATLRRHSMALPRAGATRRKTPAAEGSEGCAGEAPSLPAVMTAVGR